jgi:hypothetical protein
VEQHLVELSRTRALVSWRSSSASATSRQPRLGGNSLHSELPDEYTQFRVPKIRRYTCCLTQESRGKTCLHLVHFFAQGVPRRAERHTKALIIKELFFGSVASKLPSGMPDKCGPLEVRAWKTSKRTLRLTNAERPPCLGFLFLICAGSHGR